MCPIAWHIWIKGALSILPYASSHHMGHPDQPLTPLPPDSWDGLPVPISSVSHFLLGQLGWSLVSKPLPAQTVQKRWPLPCGTDLQAGPAL